MEFIWCAIFPPFSAVNASCIVHLHVFLGLETVLWACWQMVWGQHTDSGGHLGRWGGSSIGEVRRALPPPNCKPQEGMKLVLPPTHSPIGLTGADQQNIEVKLYLWVQGQLKAITLCPCEMGTTGSSNQHQEEIKWHKVLWSKVWDNRWIWFKVETCPFYDELSWSLNTHPASQLNMMWDGRKFHGKAAVTGSWNATFMWWVGTRGMRSYTVRLWQHLWICTEKIQKRQLRW